MATKRLVSIHVKDVKGICDTSIRCEIYPNKPNFLVAPNGSGKTSLATAFASLNQKRLNLQERDYPKNRSMISPLLEVQFEAEDPLVANAETNEIGKYADTYVINSGLYAKASSRAFGSVRTAQGSLRVPTVVLRSSIPEKPSIVYAATDARKRFPISLKRHVSNLRKLGVFDNLAFLKKVDACVRCHPRGSRQGRIDSFVRWTEGAVAAREDLSSPGVAAEAHAMKEPILGIADVIEEYYPCETTVSLYLNAIQVFELYESQRDAIRGTIAWLEYEAMRRDVNELLAGVNTSGSELKAVVQKGSLVVEFPDRSRVSNGELDILRFVSCLFKARASLKKDRSILIIDEVFDYLDEANLLVAQHFLLKMMQDYKESGRSLYAIILTHLDPSLMASYRFKTKHVSYFPIVEYGTACSWMRALLVDRDRCRKADRHISDDVSKRYLHYSEEDARNESVEGYLAGKGVPADLRSASAFRGRCEEELKKYVNEESYDPTLVCCGLRVVVERLACGQLTQVACREEFVATNGTVNKLDYATLHGAHVPEAHYLLGAVYNSCMHLKGRDGELGTVVRMLNNGFVRHMIRESVAL